MRRQALKPCHSDESLLRRVTTKTDGQPAKALTQKAVVVLKPCRVATNAPTKLCCLFVVADHAWQEAHVPNEVPPEYETDAIDFKLRRVYEGMVHCMDSGAMVLLAWSA